MGYKDVKQAIRKHVDEDDKQKLENLRVVETTPLLNTYEKAQIFINESGLYSLILKSKNCSFFAKISNSLIYLR